MLPMHIIVVTTVAGLNMHAEKEGEPLCTFVLQGALGLLEYLLFQRLSSSLLYLPSSSSDSTELC